MRRAGAAGVLAVGVLMFGLVQAAWGDAPELKVQPETPFFTAHAVERGLHPFTLTVAGGWLWRGGDCNKSRGVGVAVDWFDPADPGNPVGASLTIEGTSVPIAVGGVGDSLNRPDNVVHPTENDTGTGSVVDISEPSEYKNWRGGCGVHSTDKFFRNPRRSPKGSSAKAASRTATSAECQARGFSNLGVHKGGKPV